MTRVLPDGRTEFRCFRPDAARVKLAGSFSDWRPFLDMRREEDTTPDDTAPHYTGHWYIRLPLPPGNHSYRFEVDGRLCVDLSSKLTLTPDQALSSVITVPAKVAANY